MRSWWHKYTPRGRTVLILGVAITVFAIFSFHVDLLRIGLVMVGAALGSLVVASVPVKGLHQERQLDRVQVMRGEKVTVELKVNGSRLATGHLLHFEEVVPPTMGTRPRFGIASGFIPWHHTVNYELLADLRGRHSVGPLLVRSMDPLGFAQQDLAFRAYALLSVSPRIVELSPVSSVASGHADSAEAARSGTGGTDDVLVRDYHHGDDLRRVHWRTSAKAGSLMVRREEQSWRQGALLLLDNRPEAHGGVGNEGSFEWAVSAVASIGIQLFGSAASIHYTDCSPLSRAGRLRVDSSDEFIERMIDARLLDDHSLSHGVTRLLDSGHRDALFAVVGRLTDSDHIGLAEIASRTQEAYALVLDADAFDGEHSDAAAHSAALLREAGWRVAVATPDMEITDAWSELAMNGGKR